MVNNDFDILIVGAGPAGISTWLHLEKYHPELAKKALVIDKAVFPRDKLCGGAVGGWSGQVLEYLEIEVDCPSVWIDILECKYGKESWNFEHKRFFRIVRREEFDEKILDAAIIRGLNLHEGEWIIGYEKSNDGLKVITNLDSYQVNVLVGADGAMSNVRNLMQVSSEFPLALGIELFNPVSDLDSEFDEKKIVIDFTPVKSGLQGYIWHFPVLIDEQPFLNHGISDFKVNKSNSQLIKTLFSETLQNRRIDRSVGSWQGHLVRFLSKNDIISASNVILVGDAAGIERATAGGIHLALSYGDVAAKAIIDSFDNKDFSFEHYEKRVHSHLVGKWIFKCNNLGNEMYAGRMNPLDAAEKVFSVRK